MNNLPVGNSISIEEVLCNSALRLGADAIPKKGTSTNDSAAAGMVGEYISTLVPSSSSVSFTTATVTVVGSISLTAGDWDVEGNVNLTSATATVTAASAGIASSVAMPSDGTEVFSNVKITLLSGTDGITLPRKRISIPSSATINLLASSTFSAGTVAGFGAITARRAR